MPIPPLLIGSTFANPTQVAELVGGTTINQIGSDLPFPSSETNGTSSKNIANRVIEYRGEIFCTHINSSNVTVHRWDGASWARVNFSAGYLQSLGIWVINTGTVQRLFTIGYNSSNTGVALNYTDDGVTWTPINLGASTISGLQTGKSILYNNKLYIANDTNVVAEFDPIALSVTSIPGGWTSGGSQRGAWAIYDDRLFFCTERTTSISTLYEFIGAGFSANVDLPTTFVNNTGIPERGCSCAFTDPGTEDLIVILNGTNSGFARGSFCFRLTPSGSTFIPTDITATVIPGAFSPINIGNREQFRHFVVVSTDTPGSTEVYVFFAGEPAPGTGYSVYQWQGVASGMTFVAAGPSVVYAIAETPFGGGDRIYATAAAGKPAYEFKEAIPNGIRIYYRIYGGSATAPVPGTIKLFYNQEQEAPNLQGSLFGTPSGGILNGNQVDDVEADDGNTLYYLDWNSIADGIPSGDSVHILLDFS